MGKYKYDKIDGYIPIYEMPYVLITNKDQFNKRYADSLGIDISNTSGLSARIIFEIKDKEEGVPGILMCLFDISPNTITHECCHAALDIMDYIGETNILDSQEPFCYLVGWLVDEMLSVIDKRVLKGTL